MKRRAATTKPARVISAWRREPRTSGGTNRASAWRPASQGSMAGSMAGSSPVEAALVDAMTENMKAGLNIS